jgi:hypothetical protein
MCYKNSTWALRESSQFCCLKISHGAAYKELQQFKEAADSLREAIRPAETLPGSTATPVGPAAETVSTHTAENSFPGYAQCAAGSCRSGSQNPARCSRCDRLAVAPAPFVPPPAGIAIALPLRRAAERFLGGGAQARIGRERPISGEPGADGAFRDLAVETPAHELLGFGQRLAEIERRDGLEDHPERVGLVLARLAGEAMQALGAAIDLQCLQAIPAFAFLGGALAPALRADGIRMEDGRG